MMRQQDKVSAFEFEGSWIEFAPIVLTNLLLTLVTFGIYRFWAITRTRKYLWSRTRFIDETLEWTGTGKEMFIGFIVVFGVIFVAFILVALIAKLISPILLGFAYIGIFYAVGLAKFRALRYRLNRTFWHGIRGGSYDPGLRYGWSFVWKTIVGYLPFGLLVPRMSISLWNERWNAMSFGSSAFRSESVPDGLLARMLMTVFAPALLLVLIVVMGAGAMGAAGAQEPPPMIVGLFPIILLIYAVGFCAYYALFLRRAVDGVSLGSVEFGFTASTTDWIMFGLKTIGLIIITFGIGALFTEYRLWKFAVGHLEAYGEVRLDQLTQSNTPLAREAEGLLDALDIGAL